MRGRNPSGTWLELGNRAVNAFEEFVEGAASRTASVKYSSTSEPGDGQLIFCIGHQEVLYVSRERIAERFAEIDRRLQHENDLRKWTESRRAQLAEREEEGEADDA